MHMKQSKIYNTRKLMIIFFKVEKLGMYVPIVR